MKRIKAVLLLAMLAGAVCVSGCSNNASTNNSSTVDSTPVSVSNEGESSRHIYTSEECLEFVKEKVNSTYPGCTIGTLKVDFTENTTSTSEHFKDLKYYYIIVKGYYSGVDEYGHTTPDTDFTKYYKLDSFAGDERIEEMTESDFERRKSHNS